MICGARALYPAAAHKGKPFLLPHLSRLSLDTGQFKGIVQGTDLLTGKTGFQLPLNQL